MKLSGYCWVIYCCADYHFVSGQDSRCCYSYKPVMNVFSLLPPTSICFALFSMLWTVFNCPATSMQFSCWDILFQQPCSVCVCLNNHHCQTATWECGFGLHTVSGQLCCLATELSCQLGNILVFLDPRDGKEQPGSFHFSSQVMWCYYGQVRKPPSPLDAVTSFKDMGMKDH